MKPLQNEIQKPLTVIKRGVLDDLVDVGEEVLAALVPLLAQVVADGLQVHRPRHDAVVVRHQLRTT